MENMATNLKEKECEFPFHEIVFLKNLLQNKNCSKIVGIGKSTEPLLKIIAKITIKDGRSKSYLVDDALCQVKNMQFCEQNGENAEFNNIIYISERHRMKGNVDLLLLDARKNMPKEILNFLVVFPYLKKNAIILVIDELFYKKNEQKGVGTSVLFQNIRGTRFSHNCEKYSKLSQKIGRYGISLYDKMGEMKGSGVPFLVAFQITEETSKYIGNQFASLWVPWTDIPEVEYLTLCEKLIKRVYPPEYLFLYRKAVADSKPAMLGRMDFSTYKEYLGDLEKYKRILVDLHKSILSSFSHLLLYGKGFRGNLFYYFIKELGIRVDGFVISEGRNSAKKHMGLPVYEITKIPFSKDDFIIIQTVDSLEIEQQLNDSKLHWLKIHEDVWSLLYELPNLFPKMCIRISRNI